MISPLHASKGITIICITLSGSFSLAAQAVTKYTRINSPFSLKNNFPGIQPQPLFTGDKVPTIAFGNVLNYKSKKAKLSGFKDKVICLIDGVYSIHLVWLHFQKWKHCK